MRPIASLTDLRALLRRRDPDTLVTLDVEGRTIQVEPGTTVLEAADRAEVWIPRLCHLPGAPLRASCRLCLVTIDGMNGLVNACGTVVREGMVVRTQSPQIHAVRRTIMEMTLLEHGRCGRPDCEVEALAERLDALAGTLPGPERPASEQRGSEYISFDPAACVLCDRCVRVCGLQIPLRAGRGGEATIVFDGAASPADSRCTACGDCVAVCPSGALAATSEDVVWPHLRKTAP